AGVLLPLYYRLQLTSIYTYLGKRLGRKSEVTGASFFVISKLIGAALKFYVVCMILHEFVFEPLGVPFALTVALMVALIWVYTRRGGIRTLVFTDALQTACMLGALLLISLGVLRALNLTPWQAADAIRENAMSRVFVFDDWMSKQNFWKQFVSGAFIVVVMTGLDQDMMQKNLTCRTLRESQKNMCCYGLAFVPVNLLFLSLGVLLTMLAANLNVPLPENTDTLLPMFAATGKLGLWAQVLFTLGIVSASFSSADSALTSLTTTYCIDIRRQATDERLRRRAHLGICTLFVACILVFRYAQSTSLLDAIYTIVSYTYGPLLGLFAYGLFTRRHVLDGATPYIAVAAPLLCLGIARASYALFGYTFGYELLLLNGAITFAALWAFSFMRKPSPAI
ncbi:MAG: sodium:solute symporter, partial [Muribaculaceae bacterium]